MATSLARNAIARAAFSRSRSVASTSNGFFASSLRPLLGPLEQRSWFSSYPSHEVLGMPSLSPTMESGSIASWNLKEGEAFAAGDVLCSVETDKATVDFEAQDEGVIAKILVPAGPDELNCGTPIVVTVEDEEDVAAFKDFVPEDGGDEADVEAPEPEAPTPAAPAPVATAPIVATPAAPTGGRVIASPRAHTLAKEMGYGAISALRIVGTGPGGRIIAQDVLEYVPTAEAEAPAEAVVTEAPATAVAAAPVAEIAEPIRGAGFTDYSLPAGASEMAARLAASKKNVPHYYLTVDLALDDLIKLRSELNATLKLDDDEGGITVNDLILKAAAAAMKAVPSANASWMESFVRVYDSVDINVVVGSGTSLYSPVIKDVGRRGLKAISDDFSAAAAVVNGDGSPEEVEGFGDVGTFTVVNLGMFGVKSCAPIIREPQACSLALGTIENRIVPNDDEDSEEIYKQSVMMTATMSLDHRVVDGAVGAQWLATFKKHVENPLTLLL